MSNSKIVGTILNVLLKHIHKIWFNEAIKKSQRSMFWHKNLYKIYSWENQISEQYLFFNLVIFQRTYHVLGIIPGPSDFSDFSVFYEFHRRLWLSLPWTEEENFHRYLQIWYFMLITTTFRYHNRPHSLTSEARGQLLLGT